MSGHVVTRLPPNTALDRQGALRNRALVFGFSAREEAFLHIFEHFSFSWASLSLQPPLKRLTSHSKAHLTRASPGLSQHAPRGSRPWGRGHSDQQVTSLW